MYPLNKGLLQAHYIKMHTLNWGSYQKQKCTPKIEDFKTIKELNIMILIHK